MTSGWRSGPAILFVLALFLTGCVNVVPVPRIGEKEEAKTLARTFRNLSPDTREQLLLEHRVAQELKITLSESATMAPDVFREKFAAYKDELVGIRNRRKQIMETVRQGLWESPMVFVAQQYAVRDLVHEIVRTQTWIELAESIRLRADLGRKTDFPELTVLRHQLETFLSETGEDPLGNQLRILQEEFRFGEAEILP